MPELHTVEVTVGLPLPSDLVKVARGQAFTTFGNKLLGVFQWPEPSADDIRKFFSTVRCYGIFFLPKTAQPVLGIMLNGLRHSKQLLVTAPVINGYGLEKWNDSQEKTLDLILADSSDNNRVQLIRAEMPLPQGLCTALSRMYRPAENTVVAAIEEYNETMPYLGTLWAAAQQWIYVAGQGYLEKNCENEDWLQKAAQVRMIERV